MRNIFVLLAVFIFTSSRPYLRILSDEASLLSVSNSMTRYRRVDQITMAKWYYFNFHPVGFELDKRPLLFPFLGHLVQAVIGLRPCSRWLRGLGHGRQGCRRFRGRLSARSDRGCGRGRRFCRRLRPGFCGDRLPRIRRRLPRGPLPGLGRTTPRRPDTGQD